MSNTLTLKAEPQEIDENVKIAMTDTGLMVIIIDPTKELGISASQKSINIATTHGNKAVGKATLGLNFYKPNPNKPKGNGGGFGNF